MTDTDLFGDPLTAPRPLSHAKQWGYIMPPGTGPAGETCGSCRHIMRTRRYRKCRLNEANWTGGFKTDVLARSPACSRWEASQLGKEANDR
jgi:hypothetical protein